MEIGKEEAMRTVTVHELTSHAAEYLEAVERGEELQVQRNGKPVAMVTPLRKPALSRWKTSKPVDLGTDVSLSAAILTERAESR